MTIQQVASGGSNGILGFLFQDDGGMDGTVLEGAEFAKTLHQLLGAHGGTDAAETATPLPTEPSVLVDAARDGGDASSAALMTELEKFASEFSLPAHGAELPDESSPDEASDKHDGAQPFWGLAPFADLMAAAPQDKAGVDETTLATAARASDARADGKQPATSPIFGSGIQQLIELAREAEQAAAQLAQGAPAPAMPMPAAGKIAPANGKTLPQAFRPSAHLQNFTTAMNSARNSQAAAIPDMQQAAASEASFGTLLGGAFVSETTAASANAQQGASSTVQTLVQGLAPRAEPLPATLAKAAESTPLPAQFDMPHIAGSEAWFDDLATRVEWLKDMNVDMAELQLHPAELGQLEIHIANGDEGTTVSFVTHNADARALIEDSMPKLRELLAQQGLQLGDSQVSQHSGGERQAREADAGATANAADVNDGEAAPARRTVYVRDPNRIDHYV